MALLTAERPLEAAAQDQIRITPDQLSETWRGGEEVEADVFIDCGYVESAEELAKEYQKYLPVTEFATVTRDNRVDGGTRLMFYRPDIGFKTIDDIRKGRLTVDSAGRNLLDSLDLTRTFEVGTLGARTEVRRQPRDAGRVAMALYGVIYTENQTHGCENTIASFDEGYFNRFKPLWGDGVREIGPAQDYMGSPTVPAIMHIPTMFENLARVPSRQAAVEGFANLVIHD